LNCTHVLLVVTAVEFITSTTLLEISCGIYILHWIYTMTCLTAQNMDNFKFCTKAFVTLAILCVGILYLQKT
jgi:hypothetical protein